MDIGSLDSTDVSVDPEQLNELAPENRKFLIRNKIRKLVRAHEAEGVTVRELSELTGISDATVRNHLEKLCDLREVYKHKRNDQLYIYYPNGKPLHGIEGKRIESGDTILDVQLAKGRDDSMQIHILEKRFTLLDGESTEGAIMFPLDAVDEVFEKLDELAKEVEQ